MAVANGKTATAAATAELDKINPPAGMIIPPPGEIRETIEKTAGFVARRGVSFEDRIRESHGANPKFSFLTGASDPYNAYYEWRKDEYRAGNVTAVAAGRADEAGAGGGGGGAKVDDTPKGPPKPPDFQFSARMPRIAQKDLEVLRLTALFVAKNGRPFMTALAQREAGNPQFQFLIPNHTFHNYFQHIIDQYTLLLREGGGAGEGSKAQAERVAKLQDNVDDKFKTLAQARQRAEWTKYEETQKQIQEEEEVEKKLEFARIDWQDFVVVETIMFNESDDTAELPPPTTLNDLQYASLEDKNKVSVGANLRLEEAFPFDDNYYNAHPVQTTQLPVHPSPSPQQPAQQYQPPPPPPSQYQPGPGAARLPQQDDSAAARVQDRARVQQAQTEARGGVGNVRIRENYVPKAAARSVKAQTALCPNCKQQIPLDELEEHMRIELLDPRWKEQKAKTESRSATTNLSTIDVANNLKRLASQRSDLFDTVTGMPVTEEELARRKRVAVNSYDGNPALIPPNAQQSVDVSEQIKAIHQKFAGDRR